MTKRPKRHTSFVTLEKKHISLFGDFSKIKNPNFFNLKTMEDA
jgi:hypothetical protein